MKLPIIDNQVALTGDADAASDVSLSSLRLENSATPKVRATTVSGPYQANGISYDATGRLFYVDATAGLPAGTTYAGGLPFNSSGALCVSSDAASTWVNGVPFAANGAVSALFTASAAELPQLANLVARWSADAITPVADGTAISSWTDSVGGYTATQATGIRQPLYKVGTLGGKPSLLFNGSWMDAGRPAAVAAALDGTERTVFIVFKTNGTTSNGMLFNTSPAGGGAFMLVADGTNAGRFSVTVPHASTAFSTLGSIKATGAGAYRTAVNGSQVYLNDTDPTTSSGNNIYFGGILNSTFMVNAHIFDILVWNKALTAAELLQAQAWACDKYSQTYPWAAFSDFIVYAGNSLTQGSGALGANSYPYKTSQSLARPYGSWTNIAQGGTTMPTIDAVCAVHADPLPSQLGKTVKIAAFEYYNQRLSGAAAVEASSRTFLANRKAAGLVTVFGTSLSHSGDPDATRITFDAAFDADQTNIDSYVPLHDNALIGNTSAYATNSATYWSDAVHLNSAGYTVLAGLMTTAIQALP